MEIKLSDKYILVLAIFLIMLIIPFYIVAGFLVYFVGISLSFLIFIFIKFPMLSENITSKRIILYANVFFSIGIIILIIGIIFFPYLNSTNNSSEAIINSSFFIDYTKLDAAKLGQFGDLVVSLVTAFWSFVGILLLYATLKEQQKAIEKQDEQFNKSLQKQQETIDLQQKQFLEQQKMQELQIFENQFFNLLNYYHETINSIRIDVYERSIDNSNTYQEKSYSSKIVFWRLYVNFITFFEFEKKNLYLVKNNKLDIILLFKHFFNMDRNLSTFSHYFIMIINIFKFIDEYSFYFNVKESEMLKNKYANIFVIQLAEKELFFIYLYGLYQMDEQKEHKLKLLIEKYGVLENLSLKSLFNLYYKGREFFHPDDLCYNISEREVHYDISARGNNSALDLYL
jgi:hypothetical protein